MVSQDNMTLDYDERYFHGKPQNSFHAAVNIPDVVVFPRLRWNLIFFFHFLLLFVTYLFFQVLLYEPFGLSLSFEYGATFSVSPINSNAFVIHEVDNCIPRPPQQEKKN